MSREQSIWKEDNILAPCSAASGLMPRALMKLSNLQMSLASGEKSCSA